MSRRNVGGLDRWVRLLLGPALLLLGLFPLGGIQGSLAGVLVALAGLASLVSGLTGYCPLYVPLGMSTAGREGGSAGCCAPRW